MTGPFGDLSPCTSCGIYTSTVCPREQHPDTPLCSGCECAWVREVEKFCHIVVAPGTPFIRWYMSHWPRNLPPARSKDRSVAVNEAVGLLDKILERSCSQFQSVWDREDTLMAIAERAVFIHNRDARVIDAWNDYVRRQNVRRGRRRRQGWRNNYYSRTIRPFRGVPRGERHGQGRLGEGSTPATDP